MNLNLLKDKYTLDDNNNPILATDLIAWAQWFGDSENRMVAKDIFNEVHISTVFLGMDHSWFGGGGPPVLWETMIFGGPYNDYQERYSSYKDAVDGHRRAVDAVKLMQEHQIATEGYENECI